MNLKTTLILLALLLVVGVAYVFLGDGDDDNGGGYAGTGEALFTIDELPVDKVTGFTIKRGDRSWTFAKEGSAWFQTSPVRFPLKKLSAGDNTVTTVSGARYTIKQKPGQGGLPEIEAMDLDQPNATLTLHFGDNTLKDRTIKVGRDVSQQCYVMLDDEPHAYVVDRTIYTIAVATDVANWRRKTLVVPTEGSARQLTVKTERGAAKLEKRDGRWQLAGEHSGRVSRDLIDAYLKSLATMHIESFVDADASSLAVYGLDRPAVIVETSGIPSHESSAVRNYTLRLAAAPDATGATFATWSDSAEASPAVFKVRAVAEQFAQPADAFRDPRIALTKPSNVYSIAVKQAGGSDYTLTKTSNGWAFGGNKPPTFAPDPAAIIEMLQTLADAQAEFYSPMIEITGEPAIDITLQPLGGATSERVRMFVDPNDEANVIAVRNDETTGYHLPRAAVAALARPPAALRDRDIVTIAERDIRLLQIKHANGDIFAFEHVVQDGRDLWRSPTGQPVEAKPLAELVATLQNFRALRWTNQPATNAALPYIVTIEMTDDTRHELRFDVEQLLGWYSKDGGVSADDRLFKINRRLAEVVSGEFEYRTALNLDITEIESLRYAGEPGITIERNGEIYTSGGKPVDQAIAAGAFDALAGLRVSRWVRTLPAGMSDGAAVKIKLRNGREHSLTLVERSAAATGATTTRLARVNGRLCELDIAIADKILAPARVIGSN